VNLLPTRPDDEAMPLDAWFMSMLIKLSVARCARVSYLTHEGAKPSIESDLALYDRLIRSLPLHASPAEHQATPDFMSDLEPGWCNESQHGNLRGWRQYRKMLPNECIR